MGFEDYGLNFNNPDFVKYADSYGAIGHRPTSHAEFVKTLDYALNAKGVHLIDLAVDRSRHRLRQFVVTACVLDLALERIGHKQHAVYDGSWAEWGAYPDLAIETGPAR